MTSLDFNDLLASISLLYAVSQAPPPQSHQPTQIRNEIPLKQHEAGTRHVRPARSGISDRIPVPSNSPNSGPGRAHGVRRQINRAKAAKLFSRCIGSMLLVSGRIAQGIHNWAITLSRCWTRHIPGRSRPSNLRSHPVSSFSVVQTGGLSSVDWAC